MSLPSYLQDTERVRTVGRSLYETRVEVGANYDKVADREPLVADVLREYGEAGIRRSDVIEAFRSGDTSRAAVMAFMWGWMNERYGHLSKALADPQFGEKVDQLWARLGDVPLETLHQSLEGVGAADLKIPFVGEAFYTKLLYFMGEAKQIVDSPPLIFDQHTRRAYFVLLDQAPDRDPGEAFVGGTYDDTRTPKPASPYLSYVDDMGRWASEVGVPSPVLEAFVFGTPSRSKRSQDDPREEIKRLYEEAKG